MTQYALDVTSKFSVFQDLEDLEDEPDTIFERVKREQEEEKKRKEKEKQEALKQKKRAAAQQKKAAMKGDAVVKQESTVQRSANNTLSRNASASRGGQRGARGGPQSSMESNRVVNDAKNERDNVMANAPYNNRGSRGGGFGGRGTRSGAAGFKPNPRFNDENADGSTQRQQNPRGFDRHSGSDKTGVKAIDKRDGGGSHNWGNFDEEIEQGIQMAENQDDVTAVNLNKLDEAADQQGVNNENAPALAEPTERLMTLEEYMAEQSKTRVVVDNKPKRSANEGANPFANMRAYRKENVRADELSEEESDDDEIDVRKGHHNQQAIPLNLRFGRGFGRGGPRGGNTNRGTPRGGARGARGGGPSNRGPAIAQQPEPLNLNNDAEFPTLG